MKKTGVHLLAFLIFCSILSVRYSSFTASLKLCTRFAQVRQMRGGDRCNHEGQTVAAPDVMLAIFCRDQKKTLVEGGGRKESHSEWEATEILSAPLLPNQ